MASSCLSLLGVNPGVENLILLFVSSGDGGLRSILNLRLVCSTTKEWIDDLPKRVADVVFSRAQVKLDLDCSELRDFVFHPPPFGVTSLSLGEEIGQDYEDLFNAEYTCELFCDFWRTKLETLELHYETDGDSTFERFRLKLLKLPKLQTLKFRYGLELPDETELPSCFQKIRDLRVGVICFEDPMRSQFFTQLKNNNNLELLEVEFTDQEGVLEASRLIDLKKENTQLELIFTLDFKISREVFRKFVLSIVASKSKIRLKVGDLAKFKKWVDKYLQGHQRSVCVQLFERVESVQSWKPRVASFSLLENFPRLRKLSSVDTGDSFVNLDRLIFPSSLEELEFSKGFPPCANLPESLTSLRLCQIKCHINSLVGYLNLLSHRCPELKTLFISSWKSAAEEGGPARDFHNKSEFPKLRKFALDGELLKTDSVENCRNAIASAFGWRNMELRSLSLKFTDSESGCLPLVDGELLKHLHEGRSAKSLVEIEIEDDCVTPQALQELQTLRSLASTNPNKQMKIPIRQSFYVQRDPLGWDTISSSVYF